MHGGAQGSGGPKGARNGNYKHGRYTAETIASRRWLREKIPRKLWLGAARGGRVAVRFQNSIQMPCSHYRASSLKS
jgi:hypothetical protein